MIGKINNSQLVKLTFNLESSASLWNIIFEGFDQETLLVSRFDGNDARTINILYRFGGIIKKRYGDWQIEPTTTGFTIRKIFQYDDQSTFGEWTELMNKIREEIVNLIRIKEN